MHIRRGENQLREEAETQGIYRDKGRYIDWIKVYGHSIVAHILPKYCECQMYGEMESGVVIRTRSLILNIARELQ